VDAPLRVDLWIGATKMLTKERLKGIWVAVPTEWDNEGNFDEKTFRDEVATQEREYLEYMGWDVRTGEPEAKTIERLGLDFVTRELSKGKGG